MPQSINEQLVTEAVKREQNIPPGSENAKTFDARKVTLNTNEQRTIEIDRSPREWYVMAPLVDSGLVAWLWPGTSLAAERLPVYGGGHTRLPGRGQYLTILNDTASALELRVIALSGFETDVTR